MAFSYLSLKEFKFSLDFLFCFSFVIFSRGCKLVNIFTVRTNANQNPIPFVRSETELPVSRFTEWEIFTGLSLFASLSVATFRVLTDPPWIASDLKQKVTLTPSPKWDST